MVVVVVAALQIFRRYEISERKAGSDHITAASSSLGSSLRADIFFVLQQEDHQLFKKDELGGGGGMGVSTTMFFVG